MNEPADPEARGVAQTAYQVQVASSPGGLHFDKADLWDTGKVASPEAIQIAYAGAPLGSRARVPLARARVGRSRRRLTVERRRVMESRVARRLGLVGVVDRGARPTALRPLLLDVARGRAEGPERRRRPHVLFPENHRRARGQAAGAGGCDHRGRRPVRDTNQRGVGGEERAAARRLPRAPHRGADAAGAAGGEPRECGRHERRRGHTGRRGGKVRGALRRPDAVGGAVGRGLARGMDGRGRRGDARRGPPGLEAGRAPRPHGRGRPVPRADATVGRAGKR